MSCRIIGFDPENNKIFTNCLLVYPYFCGHDGKEKNNPVQ